MKSVLRSLCVGLIGLTLASATHAAVIVSWGGGSVTSNQAFPTGSTTSKGGFSAGNPLLLSPTSGYSGGNFYGAVTWTATGDDGDYGRIQEAGSADRIEIKRYHTDIQALILWRQADFLNGLNTGNVALDSTSTATMNIYTFVNFAGGHAVIRLEGGSQDGYYISLETPFSVVGTSGTASTYLTSLTWLSYNPASSMSAFGSPVNLLSGGLINHVTEIGFYTRSNNATSPNAYRVSSFNVTAVEGVIPEPASLSLLALSGLMMIRRRR